MRADAATRNKHEFQIASLSGGSPVKRAPENFCYQINFQIVKGARYEFRDANRESGSNASVLAVMEALRKYFPQVAFGTPHATKG